MKKSQIKNILKKISIKDISTIDLGGSCPRQVEFYYKNFKIGYLRVRYGTLSLKCSTFYKEKNKTVFDIDYWTNIYSEDFGGFGDGNFKDKVHEINTIEKCKNVLCDYYRKLFRKNRKKNKVNNKKINKKQIELIDGLFSLFYSDKLIQDIKNLRIDEPGIKLKK